MNKYILVLANRSRQGSKKEDKPTTSIRTKIIPALLASAAYGLYRIWEDEFSSTESDLSFDEDVFGNMLFRKKMSLTDRNGNPLEAEYIMSYNPKTEKWLVTSNTGEEDVIRDFMTDWLSEFWMEDGAWKSSSKTFTTDEIIKKIKSDLFRSIQSIQEFQDSAFSFNDQLDHTITRRGKDLRFMYPADVPSHFGSLVVWISDKGSSDVVLHSHDDIVPAQAANGLDDLMEGLNDMISKGATREDVEQELQLRHEQGYTLLQERIKKGF